MIARKLLWAYVNIRDGRRAISKEVLHEKETKNGFRQNYESNV